MKKAGIILCAAILIAGCKNENKEEIEIPQETTETVPESAPQEKLCFLKVTEGKADYDENKIIRDSIVFQLKRKGDSISGIFNWLPYEKDKKISTFKGTISGKTGNAIADYQAEGMKYKEELVFTLGEDQVSVMYGEMVQGDDGIWKYKNKEASSIQTLSKVDCK